MMNNNGGADHHTTTTTTRSNTKKRPRGDDQDALPQPAGTSCSHVHPFDYVKAVMKVNHQLATEAEAADFFATLQHTSRTRFEAPTAAMLHAYTTELLTAVRQNDLDEVRRLYNTGTVHCNACNRFGESILHIACRRGFHEMVQFLMDDVGLRIDTIRDDYHRTPLHDAFWISSECPSMTKVVDYLLHQPYVLELLFLPDKRGYTPLEYTREEDHPKWIAFLAQHQALLQISSSSLSLLSVARPTTTTILTTTEDEEQEQAGTTKPSLQEWRG